MEIQDDFKHIAALIGEPARALILWNLLDGRAMTATELAILAEVSAQSASMHLAKLLQAELLAQEKQGRHRYYRLARPEVAYVIESMASLLPGKKTIPKTTVQNSGIRYCRTCYDHLAGKVGVELTDKLVRSGYIKPADGIYSVTGKGEQWFSDLDIPVAELRIQKRAFARQCLDWSERRNHLAGSLGAALLNSMLSRDWLRRKKGSREIIVTSKGSGRIYELLKLSV